MTDELNVFEAYEQYEKACDKMREKNEEYLALFMEDMMEQGLSPKTINRHINNINFFLNTYLLREGVFGMEDGLERMDDFFTFFIHKCMWSSPSTIKENGASFKKFYKCMANHGFIPPEDSIELNDIIKYGIPGWIEEYEYFMSDDYVPFW